MKRKTKEYLIIGGFMMIPILYATLLILYWKCNLWINVHQKSWLGSKDTEIKTKKKYQILKKDIMIMFYLVQSKDYAWELEKIVETEQ